jgi:deazaflavin-dependent oxidoreductase (nitroreductase family)
MTAPRTPSTAFEVRAVLQAPPARVYGLLDDSASWPTWTPIDEHEPVRPPGPDGLGEIRRFRNGRYTLVEEIVAREPDRRLAYRLRSGLAVTDYRADVELEPHGTGTALRWHTGFTPKVPGTGWLYRYALRSATRGFVEGLAAAVREPSTAVATGRVTQRFLWLLKNTLNRLTTRLARSGRGPFSLVRHVGRKTGRTYETPLIIARVDGGFVAELTYGPGVQWYRNITSAGGCVLVIGGVEHHVDRIEPYPVEQGRAAFGFPASFVLRLLRRGDFRFLRKAVVPHAVTASVE